MLGVNSADSLLEKERVGWDTGMVVIISEQQ